MWIFKNIKITTNLMLTKIYEVLDVFKALAKARLVESTHQDPRKVVK